MNIIQVSHKFAGSLQKRKQTNRIIIHHAATDGDVSSQTIHQWHLAKGWCGNGYAYVIRQNGNIETGRPDNMIGAHAGMNNSDSIGICLAGNFMKYKPNENQMNSLVWLIKYLRNKYGNLILQRHKDVNPTACPGDQFPWDELIKKSKQSSLNPKIIVNSQTIAGIIHQDTAYCPIRTFGEAINKAVKWDSKTRKVTIDGIFVETINIKGVSYSKVRVLAEVFGYKVDWNNENKTATVYQ